MTDPASWQALPVAPDELTSLLHGSEPDELTQLTPGEMPPAEMTELMISGRPEVATREVLERQLAGLIGGIRAEARRVGLDEAAALELLGTAHTILERYIDSAEHPAEAELSATGSIAPGSLVLNTFVVRTLLARGGMGEIYRVRHRDLKTDHALKVIVPEFRNDAKVVSLFHEEARLLTAIRHEAVVGCAGLYRDADGRSMIVLEYLDGPSLSQVMRRGPLGLSALEALVRRLAAGLGAIHAAGMVHRDVSPDNVLLPGDNPAAAKLIDFGVARALRGGAAPRDGLDFAGKYSFASPEQLGLFGGTTGIASDIYSFGLLIVAAARGEKLTMGQTMAEATAARQRVPPLDGVPDRLHPLVEQMLHPDPRRRTTDLPTLLRPLADPATSTAPRRSFWRWLARPSSSRKG
jgi:serine/threonine protein kinase